MVTVSNAVFFKDFSRLKALASAAGRFPVLFHEYFFIFLSKGVFIRNEQRCTDSAERDLQGV